MQDFFDQSVKLHSFKSAVKTGNQIFSVEGFEHVQIIGFFLETQNAQYFEVTD